MDIPMPSQILIMPIDLPSICLSMFLCIALCGLYRCTGIDEEDGCHAESCERCCDCLFVGSPLRYIKEQEGEELQEQEGHGMDSPSH